MNFGRIPKPSLDMKPVKSVPDRDESLDGSTQRLKKSSIRSSFSLQTTRARRSANAAKYYERTSYRSNGMLWINKTLRMDVQVRCMPSKKIFSKIFEVDIIKKLVDNNDIKLKLHSYSETDFFEHISTTKSFNELPVKNFKTISLLTNPAPMMTRK